MENPFMIPYSNGIAKGNALPSSKLWINGAQEMIVDDDGKRHVYFKSYSALNKGRSLKMKILGFFTLCTKKMLFGFPSSI